MEAQVSGFRCIARYDDPIFATVFSEQNKVFRRTDRVYSNTQGFHYLTREGYIRGPFNSKDEVSSDLDVFITVTEIEKGFTQSYLL
jgi:hypothetical protein